MSLQLTALDISYVSVISNNNANQKMCSDHLAIMDGDGTTLMRKTCGSWKEGVILEASSAMGKWNQQNGSTLPIVKTSRSNIVSLVFSAMSGSMGMGWTGWSVSWSAVTPGKCQQLFSKCPNFIGNHHNYHRLHTGTDLHHLITVIDTNH